MATSLLILKDNKALIFRQANQIFMNKEGNILRNSKETAKEGISHSVGHLLHSLVASSKSPESVWEKMILLKTTTGLILIQPCSD